MIKQLLAENSMNSDAFHETGPTNSSTDCHSEHSVELIEDPQSLDVAGIHKDRIYGVSTYLTNIYESLKCFVCLKIPVSPLQCRGCYAIACSPCKAKLKGINKCPTRCTRESYQAVKKTVRQLYENLSFNCKNAMHGCSRIVPYEFITDHEKGCGYTKVQCLYCLSFFDKSEVNPHVEKCGREPVACGHGCVDLIMKKDLEMHEKACPQEKVICLECHTLVRRSSLKVHQEVQCPEVVVECKTCNVATKRREGHNCISYLFHKIEETNAIHAKRTAKLAKTIEKNHNEIKNALIKERNLEDEMSTLMQEVKRLRKVGVDPHLRGKKISSYKNTSDKKDDRKTKAYFKLLENNN